MAPTATGPEWRPVRDHARLRRRRPTGYALILIVAVAAISGCSSSATNSGLELSTSSTTDPTTAVDQVVLAAWKAAETAFYRAEANPQGLYSSALTSTMVDPELELVKTGLAGDEADDFIGQGPWSLGNPRVVSLGPTEISPTTATVVSCIHDTQILVNEHTGQAASGLNGTPDWVGETSTMLLSQGRWKLSQQSAVANTSRSVACAGI